MAKKKFLLIVCLMICFISISAAYAGDINEISSPENESSDCPNNLGNFQLEENLKAGDFTEIQNKIDCANENDTVEISGKYILSQKTSINVTKPITIEGKGLEFSIDEFQSIDYMDPVFNIASGNVIMKNIAFTNIYNPIEAAGDNISIINCTFMGANNDGINVKGSDNCIMDSKFIGCRNTVKFPDYDSRNNRIVNCLFEDTIPNTHIASRDSTIHNCTFRNNHNRDSKTTGAIRVMNDNISITHCNFFNNFINDGGVIYIEDFKSYCLIDFCTFTNNTSFKGNSITSHGQYLTVSNSNFAEEHSYGGSSSIYLEGNHCRINNCTSNKNYQCSAISIYCDDTVISNCTFSNAFEDGQSVIYWQKPKGKLTNCSFINIDSSKGHTLHMLAAECEISNCIFDSVKGKILLYSSKLSFDNNYWGQNYQNAKSIMDGKIIAYQNGQYSNLEYKAPNSWVNLKIEGESQIDISKSKEYKISFTSSDGSKLKSSLPDYGIKVEGNSLNKKTVHITSNMVKINYAGNVGGTNYIRCLNSEDMVILSKKIVVKKATPKIIAGKKTYKINVKTKKYTMTLKNNQNKAIKNAKVFLKVKGKIYSAKTNSNGKATFKITKLTKKGTFKATITYKGNSYYNKVTKKVNITVKI